MATVTSAVAGHRWWCSTPFFFNDTATTEIYTLSLHDALPISTWYWGRRARATTVGWAVRFTTGADRTRWGPTRWCGQRSVEHTTELQSLRQFVCRLMIERASAVRRPSS